MPDKGLKKKKVCIVEDEEMIREIYRTSLERKDFEVVTASDGEEGLRAIRTSNPDLVLLDILMPKMDGVSLLKIIRKDPNFAALPVIVMTNVDDHEIVKKTAKLDVSFYLVKSLFNPKKMVSTVEEVMHNV